MLKTLKKNITNIPGWRTNRKIVVFESDDWGMIRMKSKKSFEYFLSKGYEVDDCPYSRYDALESNTDLEFLLEVLASVKDKNGSSAVMTINNTTANPDFEKIKNSGFQEYHFEPFTETLEKYPGRDRVMDLYRQGIENGLVTPQFHGREHLNVNRWMGQLNSGNKVLKEAFERGMFTVHKSGSIDGRRDNLDAFGMGYEKEWVNMEEVINTGINLFESIWGFLPSSFIAPCYTWPPNIEPVLHRRGIRSLQGTHVQRVPVPGKELKVKRKYHFQGQKNKWGQRYLVRNVFFEPSENENEDTAQRALSEIKMAFSFKKPAVISSHRVNYMGSIRPENRARNLNLLKELLTEIIKRYPEVEFMSSSRLCSVMNREE